MQLVVEYLVIIEKEATEALYHLCSSAEEFNRLLQANPEIGVKGSRIIYKDSFECDYDIKGGEVEGKPQRYFHLKFAFAGGADFVCLGMFDFQVKQDVALTLKSIAESKNRKRPWMPRLRSA